MNQDLIRMSRKYGSNSELVLAGGGNTSFKNDDTLWVKASGTSLASIDSQGFVAIDRRSLQKMWEKSYDEDSSRRESQVLSDLMAARLPGETGRPSVETALHDLIGFAYILHLHPCMINGITCSIHGKSWVESVLGDRVLWMDATNPGYILAKTAKEKLEDYRRRFRQDPSILLLENHGVFFGADTVEEMDGLVEGLLDTVSLHTQIQPILDSTPNQDGFDAIGRQLSELSVEKFVVHESNKLIDALMKKSENDLELDHAFTPDHLVYCHRFPMISKPEQIENRFREYERKNGCSPRVVLVLGYGLFGLGSTQKQAEISRDVYMDAMKIATYSQNFGGPKRMSSDDIEFILHWEVEQYRAKATAIHHG